MDFLREENNGSATLKISGDLSVYEVAALRKELVDCIDMYDGLALDLDEVTDFDVAGIQLLYSARRTAIEAGKVFSVQEASGSLREALDRAGIRDFQ